MNVNAIETAALVVIGPTKDLSIMDGLGTVVATLIDVKKLKEWRTAMKTGLVPCRTHVRSVPELFARAATPNSLAGPTAR